MSEQVKSEIADGVLTLTIARPDKKNALTNDMYGALADALDRAESDAATRVVLIQAQGDMFSAGNDVGEFAAQATGMGSNDELHVVRFLRNLAKASRPLVAAVQGRAVGVGTTMLLHCDMVVLAEDALLATPFVNLALVPEAASSFLMPARIGYVRAFEMFALGEPVSAKDALAWGLANQVVPVGLLHVKARELAQRMAAQPVGALAATKRLMRDPQILTAHMDAETVQFVERLGSPEAREAFAAFAQRRPPNFSNLAG